MYNQTYSDLCESLLADIRKMFLANKINNDGTFKRIPKLFAPWAARNPNYTKAEKQRMLKIVEVIATLNQKNIWQLNSLDIRLLSVLARDEAKRLDTKALASQPITPHNPF